MSDVEGHRAKYARVERERVFLVAALPRDPPWVRVREIVDRYFAGTGLRLRRMTERVEAETVCTFKLTQKIPGRQSGSRRGLITNVYLSKGEYELLSRLPGEELRKTRYSIPPMVVDVFAPPLNGLILAEVEFATDEEMERFTPPDHVVAEVTADVRFTGGELAHAAPDQVTVWLAGYGLIPGERGAATDL